MAKRNRSPFDLLDPRQRAAAALVLSAVALPAETMAVATLWKLAARIAPGGDVHAWMLGDRAGALRAARDLLDELLNEAAP